MKILVLGRFNMHNARPSAVPSQFCVKLCLPETQSVWALLYSCESPSLAAILSPRFRRVTVHTIAINITARFLPYHLATSSYTPATPRKMAYKVSNLNCYPLQMHPFRATLHSTTPALRISLPQRRERPHATPWASVHNDVVVIDACHEHQMHPMPWANLTFALRIHSPRMCNKRPE